VYSTRLHVFTRASLTDILARKSALVGQVGGQLDEDRRACQALGKQHERGSRWTRQLPLEDPRAEVGEDVRVGVGPMEFNLYEVDKNGVNELDVLRTKRR